MSAPAEPVSIALALIRLRIRLLKVKHALESIKFAPP